MTSLLMTLAASVLSVLPVPTQQNSQAPQSESAPARTGSDPADGNPKPGKEQKEGKPAKKKEDSIGFRWTDHPSLRLGPGTHVDFRARFQGDIKDSDAEALDDDDDESSVDIARKRIGIDGEILNIFDYQVEGELGDDTAPWRDVYVNYKQYRFAEVQAGKFKLPFSLDENTSATNLDFAYRSRIASYLAPGRDKGMMVHGRLLQRGILRYELGVFHEDGDNARTHDTDRVHGNRTVAGRAVVQPFRSTKSLASDLMFGAAFTRSDVPDGITNLRGRTALDDSFYRPGFFVNGQRQRFGLETRWRPGPFSIKSEYIRLSDQRLGQGVDDLDLDPFVASGWYLSGTWAVTGEKKAEGLENPRRPIFQGGFGAVEVGVRVERIKFGSLATDGTPSDSPRADVILGNADRVLTFGVNWYANRWIKIQANLIRDSIAFPDQGPLPLQPVYWSRVIRFQFSM